MTYDVTRPLGKRAHRVTVRGIKGDRARVRFYNPHDDRERVCQTLDAGADFVKLEMSVVDHPRLVVIEE